MLVVVPAASWGCRDHGVVPPAGTTRKGRPSRKLAGDCPKHQRAPAPQLVKPSLLFKPRVRRSRSRGQFEKLPHGQSEISSTSCPSACWRLWYRRWYHSMVSLRMLSAVRFPWVCCSDGGVSGPLGTWRLGLCVVQGSARPEPVDRLLNSSSAFVSEEESTRTEKPFHGTPLLLAPNVFDWRGVFLQPYFSGERDV